MANAEAVNAPRIRAPREKTGSTDFGNIMHRVPGSCIRVAFVEEGAASHSQDFVNAGKTEEAHQAVVYGAKILAGTAADLIADPKLLAEVKEEFQTRKKQESSI